MFTRRNVLYALTFALAAFAAPSVASPNPTPNAIDSRIIDQAITVLSKTKTGASSAKYLRSGRVTIKFAKCNVILNKPVAACFTYKNKSIYLSPSLREAPVSVVAAYLAHEASHASRAILTAYQLLVQHHTRNRQQILINEEMVAYMIQARVWREIRDQEGTLARIFVPNPWVASMDNFTDMLLMGDENQRRYHISAKLGYAKEFRRSEKAAISSK